MKTSPYVAFYPSDFLVGTMCMSAEEVGAYMRLLCFQWQQGGIPKEEDKLARISGLPARKLTLVLTKFDLHEDGLLKNQRMERERVKVESFRDRQSENGKKGGRPRKPKDSPTDPTENPRVPSGFSQTETKKSQSETEAESESKTEPETSFPPNPPGGRVAVGDLSADEAEFEPEAKSKSSLTTSVESDKKPSGWNPTPEQIQIGGWFSRRPTTVWSAKELKAWKLLRIEEEDLEILNWFYTESGYPYLRRDLLTLLQHWRGEVDRARTYNPEEARR